MALAVRYAGDSQMRKTRIKHVPISRERIVGDSLYINIALKASDFFFFFIFRERIETFRVHKSFEHSEFTIDDVSNMLYKNFEKRKK